MKKFVYLYFGGSKPENEETSKAVMAAWMNYYGKLGNKVVDGGAPFAGSKMIGGGKVSGCNGYTIVNAENLDEAVAMTDGHPHLASGGIIEVQETMPIAM